MTSNSSGSTTAKRRAIACLHCREKKVKCRLLASSNTTSRSSRSQEQISPTNRDEIQEQDFEMSSREHVLMSTSGSIDRRGSATESHSTGHRTLRDTMPTDQQQAKSFSPVCSMASEPVSPADIPNIMSPPATTTGTAPFTDLWDIDHVETQTSVSADSTGGESRSSLDFNTSLIEPNMGHGYHGMLYTYKRLNMMAMAAISNKFTTQGLLQSWLSAPPRLLIGSLRDPGTSIIITSAQP
ncbi:hypothetical protein FGADI_8331 [Fusarium gaditjirri]|uniref:Zn(2)-C6 fungal-type domain-containing protein n=1 Tax=Fusarium gaditjirri TaxID=282569 RepID=A0A8H4T2Z3_9HYPO|nr:hypothetical protein FGADI_8331 [Fusarium gaditjirri]